MPAISIIIPVYNTEKYLKECLDSVIAQTFSDWELIIVDDGSTDGSPQICEEYASRDERINVIHKANGGFSSARNAGLDASKGDYLFFIDSDDIIRPNTLDHLFKNAIDNNCLISSACYIYSSVPTFPTQKNLKVYTIDSHHVISNVLYQKNNFDNCVWNKLIKFELFNDLQFNDCWFEDLDIFYKLYNRANRIVVSNHITYFYRKHDASFIHSWNPGRIDIIQVVDRLVEYISTNIPSLSKAARHRQFSGYYNLLNVLLINDSNNKSLIEYCWATIKNLRLEIISNPKSRLKNRIGALLSYFGLNTVTLTAKWLSKLSH